MSSVLGGFIVFALFAVCFRAGQLWEREDQAWRRNLAAIETALRVRAQDGDHT